MTYANMDNVPTQTAGTSELLASDWNTYVRDNFDDLKFGHVVVADDTAKTALGVVAEGTMVYQSDSNKLFVYSGSGWVEVADLDTQPNPQVVADSSSRPVSPFEGQLIYELDSQRWLSYDGSAWKSLFDTDVWSIDNNILTGTDANGQRPDVRVVNTGDLNTGGTFRYYKSRLGGAVTSGDIIGQLIWLENTGSADVTVARVQAIADGTPSATSAPGALSVLTTPVGATGPTERFRINNAGTVFVGNGETAASPNAGTIRSTSGSGTNIAGSDLTVAPGQGTGTGNSGSFIVQTAPAGSSGSSLNSLIERFSITPNGTLVLGNGSVNASPNAGTIQGTTGLGTNISGANLTIQGGAGTGTGSGGAFIINTAPAGASGSTTNAYVERFRISSGGVVYIGNGVTNASPNVGQIRSTGGSGTDVSGGDFYFDGGPGTGTGAGGSIILRTAPAGSTGSTANSIVERLRITSGGSVILGNGATNASPNNGTIAGTSGSGTNIAGASLTVAPGQGTGTGAGGAFVVQTAPAGSSGSSLNALVERFRVASDGGLYFGNGAINASPPGTVYFNATSGSGTNVAGSNIYIQPGAGTGSAAGGSFVVATAPAGTAGTTPGSLTARTTIDSNGFMYLNNGSFGRAAPVTKTGSFSVGTAENWLICNSTSTITVTLPDAATYPGREIMIKNINTGSVVSASSNVVPIGSASAGTAILPANVGTHVVLVSNGTNWIVTGTNQTSGLVYITSGTVSAGTSLSINNCFSADYKNYRIVCGGGVSATSNGGNLTFKLRVGGSDTNDTAYYNNGGFKSVSSALSNQTASAQASALISQMSYNTANSRWGIFAYDVFDPFGACFTGLFGFGFGVDTAGAGDFRGLVWDHRAATSYDGFSLTWTNNTTATVRVYGYKD